MQAVDFNKRIFTYRTFVQSLDDVLVHLDDMREASRGGRISRQFAERIMLAVTQVNGCRYCDYGHTLAALKAGVSEEEIAYIRDSCFEGLPADETPALIFAQHFAETAGNPDPEAWGTLVKTYGEEGARDIMAYIRMITFGNLAGNTFDAVLSRLKGRPSPESSLGSEIAIMTVGPVLMVGKSLGAMARHAFKAKAQPA